MLHSLPLVYPRDRSLHLQRRTNDDGPRSPWTRRGRETPPRCGQRG